MLDTPLARHKEPWETIVKSIEALDAAQWEHRRSCSIEFISSQIQFITKFSFLTNWKHGFFQHLVCKHQILSFFFFDQSFHVTNKFDSTGIEAELISLGVQYSLHLFTFLLPSDFWLFMTQILLQKIHWSDNSLLQVKSTNEKNFCSTVTSEFIGKLFLMISRICPNFWASKPLFFW